MDVSLYAHDKELDQIKRKIPGTETPQSSKDLLLDFVEDCLTGWKVPKVSTSRTITLLRRLRLLTTELGKNREWLRYEERDTKRLLMWIDDAHPLPDGAWSQHSYRIVLRKCLRRIHLKTTPKRLCG